MDEQNSTGSDFSIPVVTEPPHAGRESRFRVTKGRDLFSNSKGRRKRTLQSFETTIRASNPLAQRGRISVLQMRARQRTARKSAGRRCHGDTASATRVGTRPERPTLHPSLSEPASVGQARGKVWASWCKDTTIKFSYHKKIKDQDCVRSSGYSMSSFDIRPATSLESHATLQKRTRGRATG
jgi:hypothetical protein